MSRKPPVTFSLKQSLVDYEVMFKIVHKAAMKENLENIRESSLDFLGELLQQYLYSAI